jgi:hypothetical protein
VIPGFGEIREKSKDVLRFGHVVLAALSRSWYEGAMKQAVDDKWQ